MAVADIVRDVVGVVWYVGFGMWMIGEGGVMCGGLWMVVDDVTTTVAEVVVVVMIGLDSDLMD